MTRGNTNVAQAFLQTAMGKVAIHVLEELTREGVADLSNVPISIKVLTESVLRNVDGHVITVDDVARVARWRPDEPSRGPRSCS